MRLLVVAVAVVLTMAAARAQAPVAARAEWDVFAGDPGTTAVLERNGVEFPCGSFTAVSATQRRCTATIPPGAATFRLRMANGAEVGPWSEPVLGTTDPGARPGVATIIWHQVPPLTTPTPFPTTGILDAFGRASGPLGASWAADQMNVGLDGHDIVGNRAGTGVQSYYVGATFAANQEVYVTAPTVTGTIIGVHARIQEPRTANARCYEVSWTTSGRLQITRVRNAYAQETTLASVTIPGVTSGAKLGARVRDQGNAVGIDVYIDTGGGWTHAASASDTDALRITGAGLLGMVSGSPDQGLLFDDFGGGALPQQ